LYNRFDSIAPALSFINIRLLRDTLYNPDERSKIQPSFILSGLAMAFLVQSGQRDVNSSSLRNRAVTLRDQAQLALEVSWNSQWVDPSLAQAAVVCDHPLYFSI
jgi:hypothetical protein